MASRNGRKAEHGPHRGAQDLGIDQLGAPRQRDDTRRTEAMRGADHRSDVARILNRIEDQDHAPARQRNVLERGLLRLDDDDHALRMLGGRELGQLPVAEALDPRRMRTERRRQRRAARCSFQRGRHQCRANGHAGREDLFHQPHAFGQREPAPFAAAPELQMTNQGFE